MGEATDAVSLEGALILQEEGFESFLKYPLQIRGTLKIFDLLLDKLLELNKAPNSIVVHSMLKRLYESITLTNFDIINI